MNYTIICSIQANKRFSYSVATQASVATFFEFRNSSRRRHSVVPANIKSHFIYDNPSKVITIPKECTITEVIVYETKV